MSAEQKKMASAFSVEEITKKGKNKIAHQAQITKGSLSSTPNVFISISLRHNKDDITNMN